MKRLWFGAGLLAVVLILGILLSSVMECSNKACSQLLRQAAQTALAGDAAEATRLSQEAKASWEKNWAVTAALADHQPMDDIDVLFAELDAYLQAGDLPHVAGTGAHLASLLDALSQSHQLTMWNLLSSPLPTAGFPLPKLPRR